MTSLDVLPRDVISGDGISMLNSPAALEVAMADSAIEPQPAQSEWTDTALTAVFAAAAVLFVSFIAVMTVLV